MLLARGGAGINTERGSMVGSVNLSCLGSKPGVPGQLSGKDIALASLALLETSFSSPVFGIAIFSLTSILIY